MAENPRHLCLRGRSSRLLHCACRPSANPAALVARGDRLADYPQTAGGYRDSPWARLPVEARMLRPNASEHLIPPQNAHLAPTIACEGGPSLVQSIQAKVSQGKPADLAVLACCHSAVAGACSNKALPGTHLPIAPSWLPIRVTAWLL